MSKLEAKEKMANDMGHGEEKCRQGGATVTVIKVSVRLKTLTRKKGATVEWREKTTTKELRFSRGSIEQAGGRGENAMHNRMKAI